MLAMVICWRGGGDGDGDTSAARIRGGDDHGGVAGLWEGVRKGLAQGGDGGDAGESSLLARNSSSTCVSSGRRSMPCAENQGTIFARVSNDSCAGGGS